MKIYQIDAFAKKVFSGNPAAVCPLDEWLSDEIMLKIAGENNLSETAFYVKKDKGYEIRWFTPKVEVNLCGHATLAAAFVLFHLEGHLSNDIHFYSPRSGQLNVNKTGDLLTLDFPADVASPVELTNEMINSFDIAAIAAYKGKTDLMLIFENESQIQNIRPSLDEITKLDYRGVIVTAAGDDVDFVSRFFAPQVGVDEDAATGSAHTLLTPYWTRKLNKSPLTAVQLSERKGYLQCNLADNRVEIAGQGRLYLKGEIYLS